MPPETADLLDLADLKMLPAWVKEPPPQAYREFEGETEERPERREESAAWPQQKRSSDADRFNAFRAAFRR